MKTKQNLLLYLRLLICICLLGANDDYHPLYLLLEINIEFFLQEFLTLGIPRDSLGSFSRHFSFDTSSIIILEYKEKIRVRE